MMISLVILWAGGYFVIHEEMTLGSLLAFNALTVYYLDPIERLINIQPTLQSSFVAARRIAEITDLDTEPKILKKIYLINLIIKSHCRMYLFSMVFEV